ncbi:uncharacterized protein [Magallana gigas]|uniref:uncharacterized protein n=1 Tax=Magallana gigas TaxID=29159 RepID=UPI003341D558
MISWDILNFTIPKFVKMKRWPFVLPVIEMVFATESLTAKCFRGSNKGFTTFSKQILITIFECLEKMKLEHNEFIDVWDHLIEITIPLDLMGVVLNEIKLTMQMFLTKKISTPSFLETLIQIYCKPEDKHHSACIEVIGEVVFKALEDRGKYHFYSKKFSECPKYAEMICKHFEKNCTGSEMKKNTFHHLEFALTWPTMSYVLTVQYKKIAKVSKNCQTHLMDIKKSLMKSAKELENGSIQIRKLNLILESKREYKEVIAVIWEHEHCGEFEEGRISYLLERRHKELEKIDETFKHIIGFKELLQCFEENTIDASKLKYKDEQPLKLFLRTGASNKMDDQLNTKDYNPEVQIESFPLELIKNIPRLNV